MVGMTPAPDPELTMGDIKMVSALGQATKSFVMIATGSQAVMKLKDSCKDWRMDTAEEGKTGERVVWMIRSYAEVDRSSDRVANLASSLPESQYVANRPGEPSTHLGTRFYNPSIIKQMVARQVEP
jgi:hypothetical protein